MLYLAGAPGGAGGFGGASRGAAQPVANAATTAPSINMFNNLFFIVVNVCYRHNKCVVLFVL